MTEFIMMRHGEPDFDSLNEWAGIGVAKNYYFVSVYQVYAGGMYDVQGAWTGCCRGASSA